MSLLWWAFLANAGVLLAGAALLILAPVTVTAPVATIAEAGVLVAGVIALLLFNLVVLRRALSPLRRLTVVMGQVDPQSPGQRIDALGAHSTEVDALADAFNAMLDRLELERRESTRSVLAAQEGERLRIARELHDELGQVLTATAMAAESAATAPSDERAQALMAAASAIRETLDDVRRISRELRPEALDDLGLGNALIALCRRVDTQSPARVRASLAAGLPAPSREVDLVVYRVAQESLTNAIRHADAATIDLSLTASDGQLTLVIRDDGRGMPNPLPDATNGLAGMRERAILVGGQLDIVPPPGGGTEIRLRVPTEATP